MVKRSRFGVGFWSIIALAILLSTAASVSAFRAAHRIFPSFLFDPSGAYSLVGMPHWKNHDFQLVRNSRIVQVGSRQVGEQVGYLDCPGNRIYGFLDSARAEGGFASIRIRERSGERILRCELREFGSVEILLLFVVYLCFGWFALLTTLLLREIAGRGGARFGGVLASVVLGFGFLATFFDFHTNAWLFPVFQVANVGTPLALLLMCLEYPFPMLSRKAVAGSVRGLMACWFAVAVADQVLRPLFGFRTFLEPEAIDAVTKTAMVLTGAVIVARVVRGKAEERASFVAIGAANGVAILVLGTGIALSLAFKLELLGFAVNVLLPVVPTFFVLCFGYAAVRHNLLASDAVFNRKALRWPTALLATSLATVTYTLVSMGAGHRPRMGLLDVWLLCSLFAGIFWLLEKLIQTFFFRAVASYRSMVSELGDFVAGIRDEREIAEALRAAVSGLLPHHQVAVLVGQELAHDRMDSLAFPMLSHEKTLGMLLVTSTIRSPLLTEEDVNLLRMIATLGAIGINNARNMNALEEVHSQNIDFTRKENVLSLQVFGAEIAHEIQYPITYFKYLLDELRSRRELGEDDVELGSEEIRRLERMVQSMKQFRHPSMELGRVNVLETARRAVVLLKDHFERHGVVPLVEIQPHANLLADKNLLIQILSNLLKNAVEATGESRFVQIGLEPSDDGSCAIVVRDSGPGLPAMDVFSPWVTTKSEGRGIGLTVCQRIARVFQWEIQASRENDLTCFSIMVPRESVILDEGVAT